MRIRGVLGDRFQTCPHQTLRIEHRRIPTTQGGQQLSGIVDPAVIEQIGQAATGPRKTAAPQRNPGGDTDGRHACATDKESRTGERPRVENSRETAVPVSNPLKPVCTPTKARHRMAPGRIPENPIGHVSHQDPGNSRPSATNHSGTAIPP